MLMCQNLFKSTSVLSRSLSLSAFRLIEVPSSKPLSEERQAEMDESRKKLLWRQKPYEKKDQWYSKFKLFLQDDDEPSKDTLITRLQQPVILRPTAVKKWWKKNMEQKERFMQQYIPERHNILGNDLAAAHFLVFRNGRVRFAGEKDWVQLDKNGDMNLPNKYVHGMFVEAIDCENMEIYYEGMENLRRLKNLRFLSYKNVKGFDDWCLDRVSGSEYESLEVLNLSGTEITYRGIQALYRVPSLKKLILDDPYRDLEWKLVLAMLQELYTDLEIIENKPTQIAAESSQKV